MDSWEIFSTPSEDKEVGIISEAASLRDIQTVATVASSRPTEVKKSPAVCFSVENGHTCIALDSSVISLADSYMPQGVVKYESSVDCLALSHHATFLFTCLSDGCISMIHLPQNRCILKRNLVQVEEKTDHVVFQNIFFIKKSENETSEVVILTADTLFHFVNIQLEGIEIACEDINSIEVQNILAEIVNFEMSLTSNGASMFTNFGCCNFLLMWDDENVNLLSLQGYEIMNSTNKAAFKGAKITKALVSWNGSKVFLLDKLQVMNIMCLRTFLVLKTFNELKIDDFTLIESLENSSFTTFDTKILLLTGFETSSCALWLYQFPSFEVIYTVDVCPYSRIINMPPNQDCILFLEGCKDVENEEIVTSLKVRKITEASCEAQLSRLLNKRLFDDALLFASNFNLNSEVIFKTKANYLLELLSRKEGSNSADIAAMKADLYSCLDKISDVQHVISFCVNSSLPSLPDTLDMLLYAKLKLSASQIVDSKLCLQVFQTLKKIQTFKLICEESQFSSNWDGFMKANLWQELLRYLFHKKLDVASLIWEQHIEDFLQTMNKNDVIQLLHSIPEALISGTLCHWLRNSVLPTILSRVQDSLEIVAAWIIQRSSTLELADKPGWPINAINLAQMLLDVCQDISSNATFCGVRIDIDVAVQIGKSMQHANESVLPKLHKLLDNLKDLKELRQIYGCKISLADYSQDNKQAVVFHLLEWVNGPDEIPKFVKNFLKPYTSGNCLDVDDVILHYIIDVMEYSEFNWWLCVEPPWEKQIIALIHCLEEEEFYLNAICKMLQTIPVPWSQSVHNMVNKSLKSKNPLVENIKSEIASIDTKMVLMKYGFQRIDLSDTDVAETVMRNIIVRSTDDNAVMQDALVIAKNAKINITEAYIFRIKHLILNEKISDCLSLMKSLPTGIAVPCCKRLGFFARELNLFMEENESPTMSNHLFTKVGIYALHHLKSLVSKFDFEDYASLLQQLESSLSFQENFGVHFNVQNLDCENNCMRIFQSNVESFLTHQEFNLSQANKQSQPSVETERRQCEGKLIFQHLFQIASLLKLKRVTALEIIGKKAFAIEKYDLCIDVCRELCYPNPTDGNVLLGLICYIINEWCKKAIPSTFVQTLISVLDSLLASAAVVCEPDLLEGCAYLSTWIFLLKSIRYKSHSDNLDFQNVITLSGADPFNEWTYSTIFKETSLQVDLGLMLPKLNTCIQNIFYEENWLWSNRNCLNKDTVASVTDLIRQLKLKGQLLLAHTVYVGSIAMFINSVSEGSEYLDIFSNATIEKQKLTLSILQNVFGQSRLDYPLTLGLLLSLPKEEAVFALETVEQRSGYDYRKLQHIALVGEEFSLTWEEPQLANYYRMLQKESEWGRKFSQLHINFREAFRGSAFEKMKLMRQIANQPQITLLAIQRYCSAFELDVDEALLITLDVLLTSIYTNLPLSESAASTQVSRNQTRALNICSQVMREIKEKSLVFEKLSRTYLKTDAYNYEILEFILESTVHFATFDNHVEVENAEKGLELLRFLKTYKRISEPSEFEIELWLENSEFSVQNEKIKERLPYHSLLVPTDAVKILVSELNATTVDVWLRIADCLKLHKNEIIMMTVENLVRQIVPKLGPSLAIQQAWVVMVPNKQLLYIICDLISRIDDLEKATACATSVVKRLPPSVCKVYATIGAITFAKNWYEATHSNKAQHATNLLQKLHSTLYTDQILYEHGLNEPQYSALNEQPQELICQLYEHPSIEKRYWLDSNKFPDIHGACEQIAGITQCDLDGLRLSLLTKWILPTEYLSRALDESIIEDFCVPTFDPVCEDEPLQKDRNFKRSIYLLQRGCMEENATSLVNVILSNYSSVSYDHKLRALKCLLHIADAETIQRRTQMDVCDLRVLAKTFFCGSQLEHLRLSCELPHINNPAAARDLAIQLLQSQSQNSIALTLASDLCLDSNFFNLQIWDTILRRLNDSKVYKPLREVLFLLSSHSIILQSKEFFKAWSRILKDDTMDKNEPARGFNKLILLHRCPLLYELDLLSLAEYFNQVSLPVLTVDCFLHLPDRSSRKKNIKAYITAPMVPLVLQHLKELRNVATSLYHLDEITKVIVLTIAKKSFCTGMSSSLLQWYKEYLEQHKEMNNLVKYAVENDMYNECSALLQKQTCSNPDSEFAKQVKLQEAEGVNLIKVYSEINKLDLNIKY